LIRLENVVTSPTYDPTSRPVEPGAEQPDPRLGESSTVDTAKREAGNIKDTAADAASGVKETAKSEASNVAVEAKYQARSLMDQTRSELGGQATNQQSQLASKLQGWASEIGAMASKSEQSGQMTDLAHEASRRGGEIAHWLDTHEPGDVLEEVKRFARRRPVAFLALAAAAGVVAGRLTRGAVAANTSVDSDTDVTPARAYDSDVYDRGGYEGGMQGGAYGARTYQGGDYEPRYSEERMPTEASYQGLGNEVRGAVSGQFPDSATADPGQYPPEGTPAGEEPYPPQVGGDIRR
jgi:hypothetical protein